MADSLNGGSKLLRLSQAAKLVPSRPNTSTFWRWGTQGVGGRKLEMVRVGGFWYTTEASVKEFLEATNSPTEPVAPVKQPRSARQRRESARRAEAILSRAGI